jgi:hypothetical protein
MALDPSRVKPAIIRRKKVEAEKLKKTQRKRLTEAANASLLPNKRFLKDFS